MNKIIVIISSVLGLAFLVIAFIYVTTPANHLPTFFIGFDKTVTKAHTKHAIGAIILAVACFIFAWFQSGKKSSAK